MSAHATPTVLAFAMSDPTGAGGVLADASACESIGCHAACAITGVAMQDGRRVEDGLVVDDEWLDEQAPAWLQDMPVAAFRLGGFGGADEGQRIAAILADDPGSTGAMRALLPPQAAVPTVRLAQSRRRIAPAMDDEAAEALSASECATTPLEWGAERMPIAGAESGAGPIVDRLCGDDGGVRNESIERFDLPLRGAGDALSFGIDALLAQCIGVGDAGREAKDFLAHALAGGLRLRTGDPVPDRPLRANEEVPAPDDDDER